jgi:hypothetical protein
MTKATSIRRYPCHQAPNREALEAAFLRRLFARDAKAWRQHVQRAEIFREDDGRILSADDLDAARGLKS